jgi:hypothetical protein
MYAYGNGAPANGPALQLWRREQGWTQQQAAEWYGVHERTWRRYEQTVDGGLVINVPDRLQKRIVEYNQLKREKDRAEENS